MTDPAHLLGAPDAATGVDAGADAGADTEVEASTDVAPVLPETGVFPVLEGELAHVLVRRWSALPIEAQLRVCSHTTVAEALVAALAAMYGVHAVASENPFHPGAMRVMWLLDGLPDALVEPPAMAPLATTPEPGQSGLLGHMSMAANSAWFWETDPSPTWGVVDDTAGEVAGAATESLTSRASLVLTHLDSAAVLWSTLEECLTAATVQMPRWRALLDPAFRLWWHRAICSGHTVESARMMLGLISDPETLSHVVEWPTPDEPYDGLAVDARVVFPQV